MPKYFAKRRAMLGVTLFWLVIISLMREQVLNELRQLAFVNSHWCQEFFHEHFAGVCWRAMCGNANHNLYPVSTWLLQNPERW